MPYLFTKGFHHRSKVSIKVSMTLNMIHGHWLVNTHQSLHVLHDHWMINMFYSFMILQSLDNTCLHHITNKVTIRPSYLDTINDPSMTHQWFLVNDTSITLHHSINSLHDSIDSVSSLMSVHSIISHDSALLASMLCSVGINDNSSNNLPLCH